MGLGVGVLGGVGGGVGDGGGGGVCGEEGGFEGCEFLEEGLEGLVAGGVSVML